MDIETARTFFLWCTILNGGLFLLAFAITSAAGAWVHRMHSRFYPIPAEAFWKAIYTLMGLHKLSVIVLNLVPYLALTIAA